MTRFGSVRSTALVAVVLCVFCASTLVSGGLVSHPHRHGHGIRSMIKRSSECPDEKAKVGSYVQREIEQLSSASKNRDGKEQAEDFLIKGDGGDKHVHVQARSDQSGQSRSWSWHWSSHTSSTSSSSSSTSFTPSSSGLPKLQVFQSSDHKPNRMSNDESDDSSERDPSLSSNIDNDKKGVQPHIALAHTGVTKTMTGHETTPAQPFVHHIETKSSHASDRSTSKEENTTTIKDKDGRETSHTSKKESSTSSSTSSYSHFSNVFKYVMSGNSEASYNHAPFRDGHVQWSRSPMIAADASISAEVGQPISRPAKAETCNRRFPFTGQQYGAETKEHRFTQPFPKEALDPVSKIALDLHNTERARYGLQPLQWNNELANMASCWADLKAYGHSEEHFAATGENIAMGLGDPCYSDPMQGMKNAIYSFLDEDREWVKSHQIGSSTGHWVQAVWKDTQYLGCAVSQRAGFMEGYSDENEASMYVVCEYYPPGNVVEQVTEQVPRVVRPTAQLRSSCSANERHS